MVALYFICGSTYLAIRFALPGFPPLMMSGLRFLCAGGLLYSILRLRGEARPSRVQWFAAFRVGTLLVCGNALVVVAEQWVSSGVTAVAIASVPLWSVLFAGLWGRWPAKGEWVGLAVGLAGVALLQSGGELRASPAGAAVLLLSQHRHLQRDRGSALAHASRAPRRAAREPVGGPGRRGAPRLLGPCPPRIARRSAHRPAGGVTCTERAIHPTPPRPSRTTTQSRACCAEAGVAQSTDVSAAAPSRWCRWSAGS